MELLIIGVIVAAIIFLFFLEYKAQRKAQRMEASVRQLEQMEFSWIRSMWKSFKPQQILSYFNPKYQDLLFPQMNPVRAEATICKLYQERNEYLTKYFLNYNWGSGYSSLDIDLKEFSLINKRHIETYWDFLTFHWNLLLGASRKEDILLRATEFFRTYCQSKVNEDNKFNMPENISTTIEELVNEFDCGCTAFYLEQNGIPRPGKLSIIHKAIAELVSRTEIPDAHTAMRYIIYEAKKRCGIETEFNFMLEKAYYLES